MNLSQLRPLKGRVYVETYGCQMNVGDTQIVASILRAQGWEMASVVDEADVVLLNTCAIRDNAEQKIFGRLAELRAKKNKRRELLVGVIGCMAERLGDKLFDRADIVAGPDAYRTLPSLLELAQSGQKAINTILSTKETYEEVEPLRLDSNGVSAFVSIMRGCNNFCSYCVVPYTRGRERSRSAATIVREVEALVADGYREVTLLGQNVNSYDDNGVNFAQLLGEVAAVSSALRVRFATSHPKDLSDELIGVMASTPNIAKSIHLPAQSGSDEMLKKMNRRYDRRWYLQRIEAIRRAMPDCSITTDIIAGFSGESEADHIATLDLMREVGYDFAYMFAYSERPGTHAFEHHLDDVPAEVKTKRLTEIINLQNLLSLQSNERDIGQVFVVLVEGRSKRSELQLFGRTSQNKVVVFDRADGVEVGSYVRVRVKGASSATLRADFLEVLSESI